MKTNLINFGISTMLLIILLQISRYEFMIAGLGAYVFIIGCMLFLKDEKKI